MDSRDRAALHGVLAPFHVVEGLLVAPLAWSLHVGAEPVHAHGLAGSSHLGEDLFEVAEGPDEAPVGLADPDFGQSGKEHGYRVADLGLRDAEHPGGAAVAEAVV